MDIKIITGVIGVVVTLGSLLVFQGSLINRIETIEGKSSVNIEPLVNDVNILKSEIAVIKEQINNIKEEDNPLAR
tara:strand:- start:33001 stop:33225 length:225 start_codon:yes stop_codon:yes gene_type:complete